MVTCIIGALRQERNLLWIGSQAFGGSPIPVQRASRVPLFRQIETDEDFSTEIFSPVISSSIEHLTGPILIPPLCGVTTQPKIFDPAASVHKRMAPRRRAPLSKQVEIRRGPAVLLTVSLSRKLHFIFSSRFILSLSSVSSNATHYCIRNRMRITD
jgi:hypothetical protein